MKIFENTDDVFDGVRLAVALETTAAADDDGELAFVDVVGKKFTWVDAGESCLSDLVDLCVAVLGIGGGDGIVDEATRSMSLGSVVKGMDEFDDDDEDNDGTLIAE